MVIAKEIETKISLIPLETIFTINDLGFSSEWWENIRVKLGRMVKKGILMKIGKGRFYRPADSVFGPILPNQEETIKDLLVKDGKTIGYITGYSRWNQMGLTSQISGIIQIATNQPKRNLKRGPYSIRFTKQPNEITAENIKYLIILDAISEIRNIPDATLEQSAGRLSVILKRLINEEINTMVSLSLNYPARVRALLGAILEDSGIKSDISSLLASLNPLTTYKYPGLAKRFANSTKWHIK